MGRLRAFTAESWLRATVRDPLLHFLLIGGLIFLLWSWTEARVGRKAWLIEVTAADVQHLARLAARQWGSAPSTEQMATLIEAHIREEVLLREALAAGLDKDDIIVRRRLVQKLDYLAQGNVEEPSEGDLRQYVQTHAAKYTVPAQRSFRQVYFSPELRAGQALADARLARASLQAGQTVATGDPFMLPDFQQHQTQSDVARDFGADFARQLFALPEGLWQGPLTSALGLHVVRVFSHTDPRALTFAEARAEARTHLLNQRLLAAREAAYQTMRARYTVTLPPAAPSGSAPHAARPATP